MVLCALWYSSTSVQASLCRFPLGHRHPTVPGFLCHKQDLLQLSQEVGPLVVFISIASYDQGHGDLKIKQQQCPDALINGQWKLRVLLIDNGFKNDPPSFPQIYTIDQNWHRTPKVEAGGKIRRYQYSHGDRLLWVYGTNTLEGEFGENMQTLAGVSISTLVQGITEQKGCILIGFFYQSTIYAQGGENHCFLR